MSTFAFFGPCEVVRTFIWGKNGVDHWDCAPPSSWRLILALAVPASVLLVTYLVYQGKITNALPITEWMRARENRKLTEVTDGELIILGTFINVIFAIVFFIMEGFEVFGVSGLVTFFLVYVCLFVYRAAKRKEETDPHRDIPPEVRRKTTEEIRQYNEYLQELNRTRSLRGEPPTDVSQKVDRLQSLEQMKADLTRKFPGMKKDIDLLIEMERIRELEKTK